jgi:hypothetical protein
VGSFDEEGIKVYRLPKKRNHKNLIVYSGKKSFAHAIESGNTAFSMQQTVRGISSWSSHMPHAEHARRKSKTQKHKSRLRYVIIHCSLPLENKTRNSKKKGNMNDQQKTNATVLGIWGYVVMQ